MSDYNILSAQQRADLDRHITGNYGEDQLRPKGGRPKRSHQRKCQCECGCRVELERIDKVRGNDFCGTCGSGECRAKGSTP